MRIAIVNDLTLARECLRRVVESVPEHEVAWVAEDGEQAVLRCAEDTPDLVLMDLVMPVMNGAEATHHIMANTPCPVLVVTASIGENGELVYEAMGHGALDASVTPTLGPAGELDGAAPLLEKINRIGLIAGKAPPRQATGLTAPGISLRRPDNLADWPPFLALGASTGGPQALASVLGALPADCPAAVGIVQHVDETFARGLAEWLNDRCALPVALARDGEHVEPGRVYLAGRDAHLRVAKGTFAYTDSPADLINRPAVDVFFKSLALSWPRPSVAVLLTGMGRDGAEGLRALRERGWHTIAQDEATSVVYGMPKAAAQLKATCEILPLDQIGPALRPRLKSIS